MPLPAGRRRQVWPRTWELAFTDARTTLVNQFPQECTDMKKWLIAIASAMFVAALVTVPTGCGPGEATKIETKEPAQQAPGHAQAAKEIQQKGQGKKPK